MQLPTFFAHARRDAKARGAHAFAVAFAVVLALHAALVLWLMHAQKTRIEARETPRTIVVHLLSRTPPAPTQIASLPAAMVAPERARASQPRHEARRPAAAKVPHAAPAPTDRRIKAPVSEAASEAAPAPPVAVPAPDAPNTVPPAAQPAGATQAAQAPAPLQAARSPMPVSQVDCSIAQPDYPEAARRRGEAGTAVVRFVVGATGQVESIQLRHSSGYARLDEAALDALRSSTCRPHRENGMPVPVMFEQSFVFGLAN